ncbi:MAG: hypothetical protein E6G31_06850 [Actinobacteria bacterium]|nr:MAG: hypothetical protein E6G31_06850 [Actinomycetota bacterium]
MTQSFGCRRCYGEDAEAVWVYYEEGLAVEQELVGDSHFLVQLRRCAECGQQFVWIFGEAVDWQRGEDAQRREIVPISAAETEALSNLEITSMAALGDGRRHLVTDWPTAASRPAIEWATGELRLPRGPHS